MLKYHLIVPEKNKQNIGTFHHYLNLGSHQAPYVLQHLHAFSIVTLNPKEKLPTISNNDEGKFVTAAVPIKGKLRIDGQTYQQQKHEKQIVLVNPKNIGAAQDGSGEGTFAYFAFKGMEKINDLICLKRFTETETIGLEKSAILVLDGKITYREGDIEVVIKNKPNFEDLPNLLFTSKAIKLQVEKNSLVMIIANVV